MTFDLLRAPAYHLTITREIAGELDLDAPDHRVVLDLPYTPENSKLALAMALQIAESLPAKWDEELGRIDWYVHVNHGTRYAAAHCSAGHISRLYDSENDSAYTLIKGTGNARYTYEEDVRGLPLPTDAVVYSNRP